MPFILSRCLKATHFKDDFAKTIKRNFELTNLRQVKAIITKTWSLFAKFCAKAFASEFYKADYQELDHLVVKLIKILNKVYPDIISNLPNVHVLRHLPLMQNVSVSLKEMMHGIYKRKDGIYPFWLNLEEYDIDRQEKPNEIESPQECFFNIRVHGKWSTEKITKEGLIKNFSNKDSMQRYLYKAYCDYYNKKTAISFKTLDYYNMISYTVLRGGDVNVDISIHVGDTIDIEDETGRREYALIKGIFTHMANDGKKYAFFILNWYYNTGRVDNFTGSKIYGLQKSDDDSWYHVHAFHIVDQNPRVHFIHNCKSNCSINHVTDNLEYLYNEFFYIAV
ncbi:unnamed protein product [Rhizophagus irregularis]|nr:unnamed protein product [Rhizophagus irregularis]